ncbi:hypothetical protein [Halobacillus halophilus]|uniref:hypothetical protein n=1 Tax=Halobacillus halophilus TaxID=1570 RepID=UPI001CD5F750|nr:hypothetical protein [Halobacillus halophilus]MCA1012461.1 hypothetical protein [Halobacillus halophilus]
MIIVYMLLFFLVFALIFVIGNFITVNYKITDSELKLSRVFGWDTTLLPIQEINSIYDVDWGHIPKGAIQIGTPGRTYSGLVFKMKTGRKYLVHIRNCGKLVGKLKTENPTIEIDISREFWN